METTNLSICTTGINRERSDEKEVRTVEVEVGDFDVTPAVRLTAKFKCHLVVSRKDGPRLELRDENGAFLGYVPFKPTK